MSTTKLFASKPAAVRTDDGPGYPKPPTECSFRDCTCAVSVLLMECQKAKTKEDDGEESPADERIHRGPAGYFCDHGGKLNQPWRFVRWAARCVDHFHREQWRRQTARWYPVAAEKGDDPAYSALNPFNDGVDGNNTHVCDGDREKAHKRARDARFGVDATGKAVATVAA